MSPNLDGVLLGVGLTILFLSLLAGLVLRPRKSTAHCRECGWTDEDFNSDDHLHCPYCHSYKVDIEQ